MATHTIGSAGADYANGQAWHDAGGRTSGDIGTYIVAEEQSAIVISIDGLTLTADPSVRHSGAPNTGVRIIPGGTSCLQITGSPFTVEFVELQSGTAGFGNCVYLGSAGGTGTVSFKQCLIFQGQAENNVGLYIDDSWTINSESCFWGWFGIECISFSHDLNGSASSTFNSKADLFYGSTKTVIRYNGTGAFVGQGSLMQAPADDIHRSGYTLTLTDCILDDGSASGAGGSLTRCTESATFTTSTAASAVILTTLTSRTAFDVHLVDHANNIAIGYVPDAAAPYATLDIDGDTRPTSGDDDCGCDFISAGGPAPASLVFYARSPSRQRLLRMQIHGTPLHRRLRRHRGFRDTRPVRVGRPVDRHRRRASDLARTAFGSRRRR